MKIEKIGENRIRVTVTSNDLIERDIDINSLNYNSLATQELFADMIELAEAEFGFSTANSQFIIDPEPDTEDGFIVTITIFDEDKEFESIHKYLTNKISKKNLKPKKKSQAVYSAIMIYCFENFDDLCMLSRRLENYNKCENTLYKYKNCYYIVFSFNNITDAKFNLFESIMNEFGKKIINVPFFEGLLSEYGEVLINNNALQTLKEYF